MVIGAAWVTPGCSHTRPMVVKGTTTARMSSRRSDSFWGIGYPIREHATAPVTGSWIALFLILVIRRRVRKLETYPRTMHHGERTPAVSVSKQPVTRTTVPV